MRQPELLEVQDRNGEYMRHSDLQNLKDGKNPQTFLTSQGSLMYVLCRALTGGD